ncbi:erythromycin esterase family protein [Tistrella bauzanensis]
MHGGPAAPNAVTAERARLIRHHAATLPPPTQTGTFGAAFDHLGDARVVLLGEAIQAVLDHLDQRDPEAARLARHRYGCLTPWLDTPETYGLDVRQLGGRACEEQAVAQLADMLSRRITGPDGEALLDAVQNARVVRAAERYYRLMYQGGAAGWNLRDRHMFDTLQALLDQPGARAVVWAHNSHVGNAAATEMGWQGQFNIGELCRTAFGDDAVLVGFGTDRGTVAAARDWGQPMEVKTVRPARPDSHEHVFAVTGLDRALIDWRGRTRAELVDALSPPLLERAIGVIYRPETERLSHYFEAVLPEQFDAWVWLAETRAVTPLPAEPPAGVPDTYPFGL